MKGPAVLDLDRIKRELQAPGATALYRRLHTAIHAQLLDGTLRPGEALVPERILQEELGLSRSTIRQAIKSLVDAGLLRSVVGAGTFVLEPRPAPRERDLVGVIVPDSDFYLYYADLASSLSFRLREAGLRVDTSIHHNRYETLIEITAGLLDQEVAAVVITAPSGPNVDTVIRELRARGVVVVLLTRYLDGFDDLDYVGADNQRIGYEATRHLLELGHTGIVHLAGTTSSTARDRALGYVHAMREVDLEPRLVIPSAESGSSAPEVLDFMGDQDPALLWAQVSRREITATFCFNDATASWVQKEIRNLNLIVPRDLSLIAVDNMPYADFFDAPLTTFALPGEEIGREAANLLVRRLNGESFAPQRVFLPARFIQRRSTATPPRPVVLVAGQAVPRAALG
jgi:DNA-binding LacI/PurR family transcriptional regulator